MKGTKTRELCNLGIPRGETLKIAVAACTAAAESGLDRSAIREIIGVLINNPGAYAGHPQFGKLAAAVAAAKAARSLYVPREESAPWRQWGSDLEPTAVDQLRNACKLPVSVAGALMPDAHQGYGLPIGGVLATDNAVIPFAVGVDIACRMKPPGIPGISVGLNAERLQVFVSGMRMPMPFSGPP